MTLAKVSRRKGAAWAMAPAVLLTTLLGTQVVLLLGALDDPSFSIEDRYYDKALAWDDKIAQDRKNAELGWKLALDAVATPQGTTRLFATCIDAAGQPVRGARVKVEAFHNARAAHLLRAELVEQGTGYAAELPATRPGLWEFRFEATKDGARFTEVVRRDVGAVARAP